MNNINLDINTYSIKELEKLFKLSNNYSKPDIINKKNKLQETIVNGNINNIQKEELFIFLDNIKNRLENNLIDKNRNNKNNTKNEENINVLEKYDGNHFIINNLNNKYTSLLENNKKVNKSIIKKTYTIDSLFRQNYDNTDNESHNYLIQLPETITKAITMSISSIEIPLTYHNISTDLNNNIFKIEKINISTSTIEFSANIILTPGIYESRYATASQINLGNQATFSTGIIASNIVSEINQQIMKVSDVDISNNLSFNVNIKSGFSFFKYTNINNNTKIRINFDIDNPGSKNCNNIQINQRLGSQLGFRIKELVLDNSNYNVVDNGSTDAIVLSRTICYINYPRYLYIAIDDFQASSRNYFSVAANSIVAPNIVGRINILSLLEEKTAFKSGSAPGDFLYSQKHIREYFGPTDINKLRIQLLDEYGRNFSLNNMDWSFILSFECFYN